MTLAALRLNLEGESVGVVAVCATLFFLTLSFSLDAVAQKKSAKGQWGAIAYHSKTGKFGYAVNVASKRVAETEAFRQCGPDCNLVESFRNTCGAVAVRPNRAVWDRGASRAIAEQKALRKCGGEACTIAVWACTS